MGSQKREYLKTHPWITFSTDLSRTAPDAWMLFGEISSKAEHIANAPIAPDRAKNLYDLFLAKGAAATTAIEGNTLSEEQVRAKIEGSLELPKSQEYLGQEVQNIISTCNEFVADLRNDEGPTICVKFVEALNLKALAELELEDGVVAGKIRRHGVVVAKYRGAPAEDCYFLLETMCSKINELLEQKNGDLGKVYAIYAALFAHVYIALIHPFGDGNGRTSRLLEVYILLQAGFPMPTCQLLSNHYNKTRSTYYRELDRISKSGGRLEEFFAYALQGFAEGLREQVVQIQAEQVQVTWQNYVHDQFRSKITATHKRRRDLALAISTSHSARTIDEIFSGSVSLARAYRELAEKTLTRDLNELVRMEIIVRARGRRYRPNISRITSFLPWRKE